MPRSCVLLLILAAAASAALGVPACSRTYDVEGRETPVHVWLTVPDLAERGGDVDALVYVGPYRVVRGPVQFPQGVPTVNLPPLFIRSGERTVSVVLDGGRVSASDTVNIEHESWIQITVRGTAVNIEVDDVQPDPWGG